jgi:hypothetical protein
MTSTLLRPDINHLSSEIKGISQERCNCKRETHVSCLNEVVAEVIVGPHEEELVL